MAERLGLIAARGVIDDLRWINAPINDVRCDVERAAELHSLPMLMLDRVQ